MALREFIYKHSLKICALAMMAGLGTTVSAQFMKKPDGLENKLKQTSIVERRTQVEASLKAYNQANQACLDRELLGISMMFGATGFLGLSTIYGKKPEYDIPKGAGGF